MSVPAERLPSSLTVAVRRQGLIEPLRLTQGITRGELARILDDAANQAARLIASLPAGPGASRLRQTVASLRALSDRLWADIQRLIEQGVEDAANLAVDQQILRDLNLGMPEGVLSRLVDDLHFNALQSAEDLVSRRTAGFTLQERVYRNSRATVLKVEEIVESGLARQLSAREIATAVRKFISPGTPGGTSYAAMRLARTEINNAHHETTIRVSKDRPWVLGYQWHLSGSHPRPDICDSLAHDDHSGMGSGIFSKGDVPSKPHPQCLCFLGIVQVPEREFIRQLTAGRYDEYLQSVGG